MNVDLMKLTSVRPYKSSRHFSPSSVVGIIRNIHNLRQGLPVIVNKRMTIVAGLYYWLVAWALGLVEIPVHVATDLTAKQAKDYRSQDGPTGLYGWYKENPTPMVGYPYRPVDVERLAREICEPEGVFR